MIILMYPESILKENSGDRGVIKQQAVKPALRRGFSNGR
jgi:hypothetical protein